MANKDLAKAVAYLRTSSKTNVGRDKDSALRQREAIRAYAESAGFEIVDEFYDPAVSGEDAIEARPGFAALLDRIEGNGVRTVIIEDVSRFARDVLPQELGILALKSRGVTLIASNGDDLTNTVDPFKVMMRQIAGAFSQFEKARLVHKLKGARDRKRAATGKCEGRKSYAESNPEMVILAKKLARYPVNGRKRSLREIAAELEAKGHVAKSGKRHAANAVKRMLAQKLS
ncbi:recombinase family protein [Methylocystis sp.]|uniref:recombinase family protein n=1 Tax=Methylocystis sp. TaxID=1911079 RepID=UPI0025F467A4|nr:recombinase family protein [Methylocystis sp.]